MRSILVVVVLVGCHSAPQSADGPPPDQAADAAAAVVPVVSGLMMRGSLPPYPTDESYVSSSILLINWDQIETSPGNYDFTVFDQLLSGLEAAGISNVKLRVFGGDSAPTWIKKLGAPSGSNGYFNSQYIPGAKDCSTTGGVSVQNISGAYACIPWFWTTEYQAAYDALMKAIAERLDGDPGTYAALTTIMDTSCMAVYAEVFYRGLSEGATNHTLIDAGLTGGSAGNDWACQAAAVATHARYFNGKRHTAISINNWDMMDPTNTTTYRTAAWQNAQQGVAGTWEFLETVARPALGADLELQNNGLHSTTKPGAGCSAATPDADFFCYLTYYAQRHGFQTQVYVKCDPTNVASFPCSASGASQTLIDDLNHGIAMNAQFIELPDHMTATDWSVMKCFHDQIANGTLLTTCPQ